LRSRAAVKKLYGDSNGISVAGASAEKGGAGLPKENIH
jgi:hypothetical protein